MIIEIATERSVLVELSAEDLKNMNLTYEEIGAENEETEAAWKTILHEIRLRTGRMYSGGEVEIDMLPSRSGGCLMIVSASTYCSAKRQDAVLCLLENENALLDLLTAFQQCAEYSKLELLKMSSGDYAVLTGAEETLNLHLREFGTPMRLSKLQLASVREQTVSLKVFGSA